jgi:hypothetical protein
MTDKKTVIMGLGKNRMLANLQQNLHAVFLMVEPGCTHRNINKIHSNEKFKLFNENQTKSTIPPMGIIQHYFYLPLYRSPSSCHSLLFWEN